MLKIVSSATAKLTEKFHAYDGDTGAEVEKAITVYGKTRKQSEWEQLHKAMQEDSRDIPISQKNADFYADIFSDWDVADESGDKLACTAENFGILLDSPFGPQVAVALSRACARLRYGTPVKN